MSEEIRKRKRKNGAKHLTHQGPKFIEGQVELRMKQDEALQLKLNGMSYRAIAARMGLGNQATAHRYVQTALKEIPRDNAKAVLAQELAKLDADEVRINQRLMGNPKEGWKPPTNRVLAKLVETKIKIRDQRAKYEGLYKPVRAEVTGRDGEPIAMSLDSLKGLDDEQLDAIIDRALRSGARRRSVEAEEGEAPH